MRTVDVEHVGIATDGGTEVCLGSRNPLFLEAGVVDALQTELCHHYVNC